MLKLSNTLLNAPVMSLRTGGVVGTATDMIINPNNLKIEGWHVLDRFSGKSLVLVRSEVRDISPQGIIINDHEVLDEAEELVRLKPVIDIGFELIGKQVISQNGKKYGKVSDFAIETESLLVKKIYASQSIIKNLSGGNTSIDRTQIVEITDSQIIIEDALEKAGETAAAPSLVNS
jgi:sporulation protein YlmC with PRC-barrel domain